MQSFRRIRTLQKFSDVHATLFNSFNQELSLSNRVSRSSCHDRRRDAPAWYD
jgi:hypothetical protein